MKARKNRKLLRTVLPGLTAIPAGGPKVGTTRRSGDLRGGAGRLGRAIQDSRSTESATPPPKMQNAKARAVARWENEGGRTAKATVTASSTKKSPAAKSVRSAADKRAKKTSNASDDSAPPTRGAKNGPRASVLIGQNGPQRRKAESRVKTSKIKRAGIESRLLGHVSASGKRAQARRDSKN